MEEAVSSVSFWILYVFITGCLFKVIVNDLHFDGLSCNFQRRDQSAKRVVTSND